MRNAIKKQLTRVPQVWRFPVAVAVVMTALVAHFFVVEHFWNLPAWIWAIWGGVFALIATAVARGWENIDA